MGFCADAGIRAILLDIDGTLYPRHMLHARMLRSMFPSPIVAARYNRVRKKIRLVQETVQKERGLLLETEVVIIGEES